LQAEVHDLETASCREEKRWMMKENEKLIKNLKKDEYRRLNRLVETAMKLDPRLRRAKEAEKEAKRREEQRKAEELRREQEERERQAEEQRIRQVSSGVSAMKKRLRRQRQHQCSLVVVFPGARGAGAQAGKACTREVAQAIAQGAQHFPEGIFWFRRGSS
jgi:hypothetical protein